MDVDWDDRIRAARKQTPHKGTFIQQHATSQHWGITMTKPCKPPETKTQDI